MLWLSEFEEYLKLADITEQKTEAFMITWLLGWGSRPTEPFNFFESQRAPHIKGS